MLTKRTLMLAATVLVLGAAACEDDDDLDDPTLASLAGNFEARGETGVFSVTIGGLPVDVLDAGGFVELSLEADGTTTGRLFFPGGDEDGGDLDETLDGTWSLREDDDDWVVELSHESDTFLRDVELEVESNDRLSIDETVSGARVQVQLIRR